MPPNKTVFKVEKVTVPAGATQTLISLMAGIAFEAGMTRLTLTNVGENVCYFNTDGAAAASTPELLPNGAVQNFRVSPGPALVLQVLAVTETKLNVQQEGE